MLNEFKKFIMRGNVMDMAVGVIIGAAFGKIADSLVKDIIMPPVGMLLGNTDFSNLFITLKTGSIEGPYATLEIARAAGAITMNMGLFINTIISFLIIGIAIFCMIKTINKLSNINAEPVGNVVPTTKTCPFCISTIPIKATKCPNCTSNIV